MKDTAYSKTLEAFHVHAARMLEACGLTSEALAMKRIKITDSKEAQKAYTDAMRAHNRTHDITAHDAHDVVHSAAYAAKAIGQDDFEKAISYAERAEQLANRCLM